MKIKARITYFDKELQQEIKAGEIIPTQNEDRKKYLLKINAAVVVEEKVKDKNEPKASAEK